MVNKPQTFWDTSRTTVASAALPGHIIVIDTPQEINMYPVPFSNPDHRMCRMENLKHDVVKPCKAYKPITYLNHTIPKRRLLNYWVYLYIIFDSVWDE